jgi:hypothetical protein
MEIHVCSLKNAEEKTHAFFAGNRATHQGPVKKRGLSTHACTHKKTRPHFEDSDVSLSHHIISRKITDIYHHFDYDDSGGPCPVCVCECVRVSME